MSLLSSHLIFGELCLVPGPLLKNDASVEVLASRWLSSPLERVAWREDECHAFLGVRRDLDDPHEK